VPSGGTQAASLASESTGIKDLLASMFDTHRAARRHGGCFLLLLGPGNPDLRGKPETSKTSSGGEDPMLRPIGAAILCTLVATVPAAGQQPNPLPAGPVTIVVPLAAGGPADAMARLYGDRLSARIGRTVLVENKPGAAGNIGAAQVAKAKPDGLTWLYTIDTVLTVNPHLNPMSGFDPDKDLVPVARLGYNLLILSVNAKKVPAQNFAELLTYSKTTALNFGSAGIGSPGHVAFEYLKQRTGLNGNHVPYRGANPVLNDLLSGNIEAAFITAGATMTHIRAGTLRGLATSAADRVASAPDIPTADQAGIKGFEARFGNYILAPAGTPSDIVSFMSANLQAIIEMPDVRERLQALSTEPVFGGAGEAKELLAQDRVKWGRLVTAAGMKQSQ
jgi:tripartite-type tricarboxylate transporter receptor subunit TctC